jgi:hypothetical protein
MLKVCKYSTEKQKGAFLFYVQENLDVYDKLGQMKPLQTLEPILNVKHIFCFKNSRNMSIESTKLYQKT